MYLFINRQVCAFNNDEAQLIKLFASWVILHFLKIICRLLIFFLPKLTFPKVTFRNTTLVSNILDTDQA